MSVSLTAVNGTINENCCNGTWAAITGLGHCFEPNKVHEWNGCHDPDIRTSTELMVMAERLEQTAYWIPILRALAQNGGVVIG